MKKYLIISFALLCVLSCNDSERNQIDNYRHADKLYCEFLPIDAFKAEICFIEVSNQAKTNVGFNIGLQLKEIGNDFINKNRVADESVVVKEKRLADTLSFYNYKFDTGVDTHLEIFYGGISGLVRVYTDEEVDGRRAGENISDLFLVYTRGVVSYPEMTLIVDKHITSNRGQRMAEFYEMALCDFFSEGMVPFGVDNGNTYLRTKEGYTYLFDGSRTIHFEIPVTGYVLGGQEKSIVLTGVIPSR